MDDKAQISAELILIIAAVLAIALILIQSLSQTSKDAAGKLSSKADDLLKEIDNITVKKSG